MRRMHDALLMPRNGEIYVGRGAEIPERLEAARLAARAKRLSANRALSCAACSEQGVAA